MDTDIDTTREFPVHDLTLPEACVGCGGPVQVRFSPHRANGVCLSCHMIAVLGVVRGRDGVQVGHVARAVA